MKKLLAILLATVLCVALLAGCGQTTIVVNMESDDSEEAVESAPAEETDEVEETTATEEEGAPSAAVVVDDTPLPDGELKLGLGLVSVVSSSSSAASADADGNAQADTSYVAVLVDGDGVIQDCIIDCVQTKIAFTAEGAINTAVGTTYTSKVALDDAYNMRMASPIGAEWDEQALFLSEYVVGKTLEDIQGIAIDDGGYPQDADVATGCTMNIAEILEALEKAVAGARVLGTKVGDTLSMNVNAAVSYSSADASADADGNAQADVTVGAYTLDASGVITACYIDCVQAKIAITAAGEVATEAGTSYLTKLELDDDYNMRVASGIGAEWDEQTWFFAEYVVGKTPAEVAAIAIDESGYPQDADVTTGCTMNISALIDVIK